jgi:indole-3-glycerol phosphate synthase
VRPVTYLDQIVAVHRDRAGSDKRDGRVLRERAERCEADFPTRGFVEHLRSHEGLSVVAEIKRRSPSKGDIDPGLDPAALAADYEAGGAACLSVLTDEQFFGGSGRDLTAARDACRLPVLRKDFTLSEADVCDSRIMGADAILLIASVLDDRLLRTLQGLALELQMDALVEVHDEQELERALELGAGLVGVNQRDLQSFEVDTERALHLAGRIPAGVVAVAESGIAGADHARALAAAGYQAILVGESLLRARDRRDALGALDGHAVGDRASVGLSGRRGS